LKRCTELTEQVVDTVFVACEDVGVTGWLMLITRPTKYLGLATPDIQIPFSPGF
jgi:hypothetical protein